MPDQRDTTTKRRRDRKFPPIPYEQQSDKWREEHPPKKRR